MEFLHNYRLPHFIPPPPFPPGCHMFLCLCIMFNAQIQTLYIIDEESGDSDNEGGNKERRVCMFNIFTGQFIKVFVI